MDPRKKLDRMKCGERIVTNDAELDAMLALDDDSVYEIRSLPNPNRVGVLDVYVAWIGVADELRS